MNNQTVAPTARADRVLARPVLITDGDKGGVGKSFLARLLVFLIESQGWRWKGIDLDSRNGHLQRYHKDHDVLRLEWTDPASWNAAYEFLIDAESEDFVVIDLPAQTGTIIADELPRLMATARSQGRPVYRLWLMSPGFDSVNLLNETFGLIDASSTIVVLNLKDARRDQFDLWNGSRLRANLLAGGGLELVMPRLPFGVSEVIEEKNLPFHQAVAMVPQPWLKFDIEGYLELFTSEFNELTERCS